MRTQPLQIKFADLTHTGQVVASNTFPLGVALVASYAREQLRGEVAVEVYKYPEEFAASLAQGIPDVACFSNFSWNVNLSCRFAREIKARSPATVTVFGGPNYPLTALEQRDFLLRHPEIDFYVWLEGEPAFVGLCRKLIVFGMDAEALRQSGEHIPSVHYLKDGELVRGAQAPRLTNLAEVPSPFVPDLGEKFLDDVLIPLIQTNRGCPYQCTFCTEGQEYYNKVHWSEAQRIRRDLEFIAAHTGAPDLIIVDSNFGMFKQDLDTCRVLAELQQSRGWPSHIHVSAGKNRKERVIEAASIVNGAINLSATIQSMDHQVLENVKRRNISLDDIVMVGKEAEKLGANSYSEIILCLPGDTREAHFRSVATMVDVGINVLRMYQLMMLPGSEMSSVEVRRKHEMQTRFRVLPRCFGDYAMWDRQVPVYEIEEICVANSTMSYHDYLDCRELNLSSELFYNSGVFREVISLLTHYDIAPSRFLLAAHAAARVSQTGVSGVYEGFRRETHDSLWASREELEAFLARPEVIAQYLDGTLGSNELFKYRAAGFFHHQEDLHELAFGVAAALLDEEGCLDEAVAGYLAELKRYSCYRKTELLDTGRAFEAPFEHDFMRHEKQGFDGIAPRFKRPQKLHFEHETGQANLIASYVRQYGTSLNGLGRILLRSHVNKLYRHASVVAGH